MIDVKQAVKIATDFAKDILADERFDQVTLEEVELKDDGPQPYWYVTLGLGKAVQVSPFDVLSGKGTKWAVKYKVIEIHAETGKVKSMKIREE